MLLIGKRPVNTDVEFQSKIQNGSESEIEITSVGTSCGCTDIRLDSTKIPPRESVQLRGTIKGRSTVGLTNVTVTLNYCTGREGEPRVPDQLRLVASVDFFSKLEFHPTIVKLEPEPCSLTPGQSQFHVCNTSTDRVALRVESETGSKIQPSIEQLELDPGQQREIFVSVPPDTPPERTFLQMVDLASDMSYKIPVQISPLLAVRPSRRVFILGRVRAHEGTIDSTLAPILEIIDQSNSESRLDVVSFPEPLMAPEIKKLDGRWQIKFEFNRSWTGRSIQGQIMIRVTSDDWPSEQLLRIPTVGSFESTEHDPKKT